MALLEVLLCVVALALLVYKWATAKFDVLKARKVPYDPPTLLLGNIPLSVYRGKTSNHATMRALHQKYKDSKVYGFYQMRDPIIFIRDLELIKRVAIKDFDKFVNRKPIAASVEDNIFAKSLVALNDQQWHEMRKTLTPSFTGSKMRIMFELINECCMEGVQYIEREVKATETQTLDMEMKDYFSRFANDVIASAVFGIKVNSYVEKNNEFFVLGRELTKISTSLIVKSLLIKLFPKLMKLLGVNLGDKKRVAYFRNIVFSAIQYREEHNILRPDMIHLLMEAKRQFNAERSEETNTHATFNDEDILAQCILFFFAGFETVSTCLAFTTYELTVNPDKQQLLYDEIQQIQEQLNGEPLNYEVLTKMKYMDMVISESLRKWPPAIATNRVCAENHTLLDSDDNVVAELKKGDLVYFPIYGLHHDPENFPDPFTFKPERFNEENEHEIKNMSYIPFGAGPRKCIGNRLALMETKALIYNLFSKFKFIPHEQTPVNMSDAIKGFSVQPKSFWVKAQARN